MGFFKGGRGKNKLPTVKTDHLKRIKLFRNEKKRQNNKRIDAEESVI